jgi:histidinol-phosphate/aromatic aminotransferase/cobyric acid decarboxylase-like protein
MRPEPRPELLQLTPVVHGGGAPPGVLDFSTGISPLPAPPSILRAARAAPLDRYPHPTAAPLRARLAALHGCHADEVVVGAGSVELIWALARAFVGPGRRALVLAPAFGEYAQAVRMSGGQVLELRSAEPPFAVDAAAARAALAEAPSLVFVCRPSNPCLSSAPAELVDELMRAAPATLFVVDEAYLPLFDDVAPLMPRANLVALRSLTKVFALPGLRLGYLVADGAVARAVQAALPPWNVSSPAIAAGLAAVDELPSVPRVRAELEQLRHALAARLSPLGPQLVAAGGPFLLYDVGDAGSFCRRLRDAGCAVRDGSSFGLCRLVRVGVRPEAEQAELALAWARAAEVPELAHAREGGRA